MPITGSHAPLAHVAERHRRARWMLGIWCHGLSLAEHCDANTSAKPATSNHAVCAVIASKKNSRHRGTIFDGPTFSGRDGEASARGCHPKGMCPCPRSSASSFSSRLDIMPSWLNAIPIGRGNRLIAPTGRSILKPEMIAWRSLNTIRSWQNRNWSLPTAQSPQ